MSGWRPPFLPDTTKGSAKSTPSTNTTSPKSATNSKRAWVPDVFVPRQERIAEPAPSHANRDPNSLQNLTQNNSSPSRPRLGRSPGRRSPTSERPGIDREDTETFRSRPVTNVPKPLVDPRIPAIPLSAQAHDPHHQLRNRSPQPTDGSAATIGPPTRGRSPPASEMLAPTSDIQVRGRSPVFTEDTSSALNVPSRDHTPPRSALKTEAVTQNPKAGGGGVNWSDNLFVVDNTGHQESKVVPANLEITNTRRPPEKPNQRQLRRRGGTLATLSVSRKDTLIVDRAVLDTRLEWNQLLVSKAFKPYRAMICATDDDLPDPEDLDDIDEDDFNESSKEWSKVRDEMLNDPELTEREIASFFEGFKLFQLKVTSLKAQLEGMKAMQRLPARSVLQSMRLQSPAFDVTSDRNLGRARLGVPLTSNFQRVAGSVPGDVDRKTTMVDSKTINSGEGEGETPESGPDKITAKLEENVAIPKAPETKLEAVPQSSPGNVPRAEQSPPRMVNRSLRALSIKRAYETTAGQGNEEIQRLLRELEEGEKRRKKLEKQLAQAGVVIAEDIPYEEAKQKVQEIAKRMNEIGGSDVADLKLKEEYFRLEQDMEKYTAALQLTDEWIEEQEENERLWEESVMAANEEALKKLRRHMPVDVRNMSEAALSTQPTPNGKYLPQSIAKKFKRTNVLQLLRIDPEDIVPMHPSTLENTRVTGLTLTERRALYAHLKDIGPRWKAMQADKMTERKWTWFNMMKGNFKENVDSWQRHVDQYGPPGAHPYATREDPNKGCPLIGKACPLKADKLIDYDGDYGYPETAEYFKSDVKKSDLDNVDKAKQELQEAAKEKKALERSEALKKHYKAKILNVSLANGSCEAMDEAMDKMEGAQERWIKDRLTGEGNLTTSEKVKEMASFNEALNDFKLSLLSFADRSGMQLTGKRDTNADQPDIRSMIELSLCEEVIETAEDFFKGIEERMNEIGARDGRMKSTLNQLRQLMEELHERNLNSMSKLGEERPARSRKLKTRHTITEEVKKELLLKSPIPDEPQIEGRGPPPSLPGSGGRGGLLDAIAGRGRGGRGDRGGQVDLLAAISGRGRGGRSSDGGRGDFLAAVAARGRGGEGGRGGFLAAIAARGGGGV